MRTLVVNPGSEQPQGHPGRAVVADDGGPYDINQRAVRSGGPDHPRPSSSTTRCCPTSTWSPDLAPLHNPPALGCATCAPGTPASRSSPPLRHRLPTTIPAAAAAVRPAARRQRWRLGASTAPRALPRVGGAAGGRSWSDALARLRMVTMPPRRWRLAVRCPGGRSSTRPWASRWRPGRTDPQRPRIPGPALHRCGVKGLSRRNRRVLRPARASRDSRDVWATSGGAPGAGRRRTSATLAFDVYDAPPGPQEAGAMARRGRQARTCWCSPVASGARAEARTAVGGSGAYWVSGGLDAQRRGVRGNDAVVGDGVVVVQAREDLEIDRQVPPLLSNLHPELRLCSALLVVVIWGPRAGQLRRIVGSPPPGLSPPSDSIVDGRVAEHRRRARRRARRRHRPRGRPPPRTGGQ